MKQKIVPVLGFALFLSLAANFFMGGLLMGGYMQAPPPGVHPGRVAILQQKLSPDDQAILKKAMMENRARFDALREEIQESHQKAAAAAHAEPFDQDALDDALKDEDDAKKEMFAFIKKVRGETLDKLSPEGRQAIKDMTPHGDQGRLPFVWE